MKAIVWSAAFLIIAACWGWRGGLLSTPARAQTQVSAAVPVDEFNSDEALRHRTCQPMHWKDVFVPTQF
ncbi:MAG: hypothetical protein K2X38_12240 [Gemmataceae bacterium]|nr:hypothetical protein [Gemmataceae bacterium]